MGVVRSPDELDSIQKTIDKSEFLDSQAITITYLTDEKLVEHILPPGLEAANQPLVQAGFSNVTRSVCGSVAGGSMYVRARHENEEGWYRFAMVYTTDAGVNFGRELFGEPKKQGFVSVVRNNDTINAKLLRYGESIMDAKVELTEEGKPRKGTSTKFSYKFSTALSGFGFRDDPELIAVNYESETSHVEIGEGELSLKSDDPDPLGTLSINEIVESKYSERKIHAATDRHLLTTVGKDDLLPYYYGSQWSHDWLLLHPGSKSDIATGYGGTRNHGRDNLKPGWHGFS